MNPWEGKHIWIWQLDQCKSPADVVSQAVALDLTGLIVKGWDGSNYWKQIELITEMAHKAGLIVSAWGYSYGKNPSGEAEAAKRCLNAGADWLVIDAEVEYERNPELADAVLQAFKNLGAILGYTSFGIPSYHGKFPWQKFSAACKVALPQVYWGDFKMAVDKALLKSLADLKKYGLTIMPVGQLYGDVTLNDIAKFADLCERAGLPGLSYWDWQHAGAEKLAAVGGARYKRRADTVSDWAKASWDKAAAKGILDGTDPQGPVTREMLAVILDKCGLLDAAEIPQEVVDAFKSKGLLTSDHPAGARTTWGELASVLGKLK